MSEFMYNIGDTVEITPYLQRYTEIQTHSRAERFAIKKDVVDDMVKFAGQTAIVNELSGINYIGYRLDIDGRFHKWHQDLLMPVKRRVSVEEML